MISKDTELNNSIVKENVNNSITITRDNKKSKNNNEEETIVVEGNDVNGNGSNVNVSNKSNEDDKKQSEIYALQERIRKLEADVSLILNNNISEEQGDSKEAIESTSTSTSTSTPPRNNIGKPPRIVRTPSAQFVTYRSFSPSFETNLRQRARANSFGNDLDNNNNTVTTNNAPVAVGAHNVNKDATYHVDEAIQNDHKNVNNNTSKERQKLARIVDSDEQGTNTTSVSKPTSSTAESSSSITAATTTVTNENTNNINANSNSSSSSVFEYLKVEILGEGQQHPRVSTRVAQETDAVMQDFLHVPYKLEKLLFYGLAICVDSYLYVLTYLPIRVLWSILLLLAYPVRRLTNSHKTCINYQFTFHRRHLFHLQHMGVIIFVYLYVLQPISISMLYHWIRGQNMLKLYVLMAMVEVFDRLMSSFGQDALDSMYWNTTSRPFHWRTFLALIVVIGYASAHSFVLFVHVATLNVAMNSADNALLTVLMSNNFAEIKSTVFKKYNKTNLFKITTSDVCERFKLTLFLFLIVLLNYSQGGFTPSMFYTYIYQCAMVFSAELLADWVKHCFITKFNFIKSGVYEDYALILAGDVTGIGHEMWNIDHTHACIKRLGLSQIPCACVMIRFIREAMRYWSLNQEMCVVWWKSFLDLFIILFTIKVVLGFIIATVSKRIIDHAPEKEHVAVDCATYGKNKKQAVV